jgi:phosphoglycolate/pyridoxal phosphate phosphatase family enzyme
MTAQQMPSPGLRRPDRLFDAYIFDLDGTCYLGEALLPSVEETITYLREQGRRTVFLSNNPTSTRQEYAARLTDLGLPTPAEDVVNSSLVMVDFLNRRMPGASLFVVGETSLERELEGAGFTLTEEPDRIEAVIASFDRTFNYHKLQVAFDAIRAGAHFYATNSDRYCPVPGGGQPDAAAMIAAIEASTSKPVEAVVGKPSRFMAEAILSLLQLPPEQCIMIGDRLETDVLMGLNAGMAGALTLTGATDLKMLKASEVQPTYILCGLSDLVPEPD